MRFLAANCCAIPDFATVEAGVALELCSFFFWQDGIECIDVHGIFSLQGGVASLMLVPMAIAAVSVSALASDFEELLKGLSLGIVGLCSTIQLHSFPLAMLLLRVLGPFFKGPGNGWVIIMTGNNGFGKPALKSFLELLDDPMIVDGDFCKVYQALELSDILVEAFSLSEPFKLCVCITLDICIGKHFLKVFEKVCPKIFVHLEERVDCVICLFDELVQLVLLPSFDLGSFKVSEEHAGMIEGLVELVVFAVSCPVGLKGEIEASTICSASRKWLRSTAFKAAIDRHWGWGLLGSSALYRDINCGCRYRE